MMDTAHAVHIERLDIDPIAKTWRRMETGLYLAALGSIALIALVAFGAASDLFEAWSTRSPPPAQDGPRFIRVGALQGTANADFIGFIIGAFIVAWAVLIGWSAHTARRYVQGLTTLNLWPVRIVRWGALAAILISAFPLGVLAYGVGALLVLIAQGAVTDPYPTLKMLLDFLPMLLGRALMLILGFVWIALLWQAFQAAGFYLRSPPAIQKLLARHDDGGQRRRRWPAFLFEKQPQTNRKLKAAVNGLMQLRAVLICAFALGVPPAVFAVSEGLMLAGSPRVFSLTPEFHLVWIGSVSFVALAWFSARGVLWLARRLARTTYADIQDFDRRPAVLFLRPFRDDQVRLRSPGLMRNIFTVEHGTVLLDHLLVEEFAWLGPVIAIRNPRDKHRQPFGAARIDASDDDWREVVAQLARSAGQIVIVVDDSPGVQWEVDLLTGEAFQAKTLFLRAPRALPDEHALDRPLQALLGAGAARPEASAKPLAAVHKRADGSVKCWMARKTTIDAARMILRDFADRTATQA